MEELKKASEQIELKSITVPEFATAFDSKIEVADLPTFSLAGPSTPRYSQEYLNSLVIKEVAELSNIETRFDLAKTAIMASFDSDADVESMTQEAALKIEADRQRIITF